MPLAAQPAAAAVLMPSQHKLTLPTVAAPTSAPAPSPPVAAAPGTVAAPAAIAGPGAVAVPAPAHGQGSAALSKVRSESGLGMEQK